jgi:Tfp pilus assembly protein PilW
MMSHTTLKQLFLIALILGLSLLLFAGVHYFIYSERKAHTIYGQAKNQARVC